MFDALHNFNRINLDIFQKQKKNADLEIYIYNLGSLQKHQIYFKTKYLSK